MLHGVQDLDKDPVAQQSSVLEQVPVIDISALRADSGSPAARPAVEQIAEACRSWGFFQVTNHGIAQQLIDDVWAQTQTRITGSPIKPWRLRLHPIKKKTNHTNRLIINYIIVLL